MTYKPPRRPVPRRQAPRPRPRSQPRSWQVRLAVSAAAVVLALLAWGAIARELAPLSNTTIIRFDAIIVLGSSADSDGNPTPQQLARVNEAVHEYELGVAPRLILTGGAVYNRFVEARVMAQTAHAMGIPESAIYVEPDSQDTIQNGCYAMHIMKVHRWRAAEVISNASHLPRAGLIFSHLPLQWRMHSAPPLQPVPVVLAVTGTTIETLKTVRYLVWTRQMERCEP